MRLLGISLAVAIILFTSAAPAEEEESCGQEMAAAAEVPEKWQALMSHVAKNMEVHARWAGSDSAAARKEQAGLRRVAKAYREMAASAGRAATAMKSMRELPRVDHAWAAFDHESNAAWMREKIRMQREFAALLSRHADESQEVLDRRDAARRQPDR